MRALEGMKTRLQYSGGINQQDRMNQDKLRVLKKALNIIRKYLHVKRFNPLHVKRFLSV